MLRITALPEDGESQQGRARDAARHGHTAPWRAVGSSSDAGRPSRSVPDSYCTVPAPGIERLLGPRIVLSNAHRNATRGELDG